MSRSLNYMAKWLPMVSRSTETFFKGGGVHFGTQWFHFQGACRWHFPSSDLHENFCAGSKYIHILTILGLSTLIKHLTTSNDRLMTTNDLNSKIDTIPLCISNESQTGEPEPVGAGCFWLLGAGAAWEKSQPEPLKISPLLSPARR